MATFDRVIESNKILGRYKGMLKQQKALVGRTAAHSGITNDPTESATHLQNTTNTHEVKDEQQTPSAGGSHPSVAFGSLDEYSHSIKFRSGTTKSILKKKGQSRYDAQRQLSAGPGNKDLMYIPSKTTSQMSAKQSKKKKKGQQSFSQARGSLTIQATPSLKVSRFSDGPSANQKFLLEAIDKMTEQEQKNRQLLSSKRKHNVPSYRTPQRALIQRKKQYQLVTDPLQMQFLKLKKESLLDFRKVESAAKRVNKIEKAKLVEDAVGDREQKTQQILHNQNLLLRPAPSITQDSQPSLRDNYQIGPPSFGQPEAPSSKFSSTMENDPHEQTKNVSSELLKDFFYKKKQLKSGGFNSMPNIKNGAKKSFLSDAHVKSIITDMQHKTDKSLDRLRLQQYYDLTAPDFAPIAHQIEQMNDGEDELAVQISPNKYISPNLIKNRLDRLKKLGTMNGQGAEYLQDANLQQQPDEQPGNDDLHHVDEDGDSVATEGEPRRKKRKFHVPYTDSLVSMTQSLSIFNELLSHKKEEREQLEELNKELQLEIKHVKEATFAQKAIQSNFIRQSQVKDKNKLRKKRQNYFGVKEKKEIVDVNPYTEVEVHNLKLCNQQLAQQIELIKRDLNSFQTSTIPILNVNIKDTQLIKDQLAVKMVKQRNMIKRQKDEMTRIICESNAFYVRANREVVGDPNRDLSVD